MNCQFSVSGITGAEMQGQRNHCVCAFTPLAVGYFEIFPIFLIFVVLILCGDIIYAHAVGLEDVATAPWCTTGLRAPRVGRGTKILLPECDQKGTHACQYYHTYSMNVNYYHFVGMDFYMLVILSENAHNLSSPWTSAPSKNRATIQI
jgi:hypothetical protein